MSAERRRAGGAPLAAPPDRSAARAALALVGVWLAYLGTVYLVGGRSLRELEIPARAGWHLGPGVSLLARWDAGWYATLAERGYSFSTSTESTVGFFPLYPLLIRGASAVLSVNAFVAGSIVSALCLLGAMALTHQYSRLVSPRVDPWIAVFVLLSLPSSFILASVYSESLFLACVLGSYLLARRGRWRASAAVAALASLTRVHGLALIPTLLVDGHRRRREGASLASAVLPAVGALSGFAALCGYFAARFHDPWAYFHSKQAWGLRRADAWAVLVQDVRAVLVGGAADNRLSQTLGVWMGLGWIVASVALVRAKRFTEATWVVCYAAMTFAGGGHVLWGGSRYSLCLFPLLTLLRGRLALAAIMVGCLFQSMLLVEYVNMLPSVP